MSENYFYSSLTGQDIEDTLLGAVRFNASQELTTSQKARARQNIGAGEGSTSFQILGFFATIDDLKDWLQIYPKPGDAYCISVNPTSDGELFSPDGVQTQFILSTDDPPWHITVTESGTVLEPITDYTYAGGVITFATAPAAGTDTIAVAWYERTAPYNVYVWDGVTQAWIDNGALLSSSLIDDNDTLTNKTWSSSKIDSELTALDNVKQDTLGAGDVTTNMLAAGAVTRAKLANDALYSPLGIISATPYNVTLSDIGKTLRPAWAIHSSPITVNLTQSNSGSIPIGTEIALFNLFLTEITIATSGVRMAVSGETGTDGLFGNGAHQFKISEPNSLVALKKIDTVADLGDIWLLTGNVEVVS